MFIATFDNKYESMMFVCNFLFFF